MLLFVCVYCSHACPAGVLNESRLGVKLGANCAISLHSTWHRRTHSMKPDSRQVHVLTASPYGLESRPSCPPTQVGLCTCMRRRGRMCASWPCGMCMPVVRGARCVDMLTIDSQLPGYVGMRYVAATRTLDRVRSKRLSSLAVEQ